MIFPVKIIIINDKKKSIKTEIFAEYLYIIFDNFIRKPITETVQEFMAPLILLFKKYYDFLFLRNNLFSSLI